MYERNKSSLWKRHNENEKVRKNMSSFLSRARRTGTKEEECVSTVTLLYALL